jgi:antimicrobial peptide system SdpB family protein
MIKSLLQAKANELAHKDLLTNVYGIARAVLASGTLITFLFNDSSILFSINPDHYKMFGDTLFSYLNLFYLLSSHHIIAKIVSIVVLLSVLSGWRPRITGILHWYVTYSFFLACDFFDGGDQIASILSLLLIPFCLCDDRKWVWSRKEQTAPSAGRKTINIFLNVLYFVIRLQICVIYFHSGIAKMNVNEWINGTATYYWFTNPIYGVSDWLRPLTVYLFSKSIVVVLFTWGAIIFEIILAMSIMMKKQTYNWKILLISGIAFHFGIVVFHGLISFFFSMSAGLILYLFPLYRWAVLNRKREPNKILSYV